MSVWTDEKWRAEMRLRVNIRNAFAEAVGADHGITSEQISALLPRMEAIRQEIEARRKKGELPFLDLPRQDVAPILSYVDSVRERINTFVVVGIGGSALGNIACHTALRHPYHNSLPPNRRGGMRVEVPDNVDPERLAGLLDTLILHRTLFNVITKSGSTAETTSTFLIIKDRLQKNRWGGRWRNHVVVTTDPVSGDLRKLATREKLAAFDIPPGVGGRFSVLTPVGLLSAAASGIDIRELLAGAQDMVDRVTATPLEKNPAYVGAAVHYLMYTHAKNPKRLAVMMPYSHALKDVADWFRQLWAESLGKRRRRDGTERPVGPTPVKALGATDQHSQVQLYRDGPDDKVYTFLTVDRFAAGVPIPPVGEAAGLDAVAYLGGHSLEELLAAEERATEAALFRAGRPVTRIAFPEVSPQAVGEYFHLMEATTVAAGALFDIDPLDQPGVEAGKQYAYGLMGRPGFERMRQELEGLPSGDGRFLFTGSGKT